CVQRERLRVHELTLKSLPNLGVVPSEVRLLCDLDQPEPTWFPQLLCIYSCFYLLIKNLDHRTVNHVGGAMRALDEAVPVTPGMQIVDVTAPGTPESYSEVAAAAASSFCEFFAPLVHLSKPFISMGVCRQLLRLLHLLCRMEVLLHCKKL
ncbi:hypothetical protein HID58_036165, partial [Brassica napus]